MYVVDIETTGLNGLNEGDKIVEVGVSRISGTQVIPFYHAIVKHDDIMDYRDSWVFQNTDLTPEMVLNGVPEGEVINNLQKLLNGKIATSYNVEFDFIKFLNVYPYQLQPIIPFDIMDIASRVIGKGEGWLKSEYCYSIACPEDPAGLRFKQTHRALDDSIMEGHLLTHLLQIIGGNERDWRIRE